MGKKAQRNQSFQTTLTGDGIVAGVIFYVGGGTGTIDWDAANDDLDFTDTADGTLPLTPGGTAGTIDTDDAATDTMGEVQNAVNLSTSFRMTLVASLRADDASDILDTVSGPITVFRGQGIEAFIDNSALQAERVCFGPESDSTLEPQARRSDPTTGRKEPNGPATTFSDSNVEQQQNRHSVAGRIDRVQHVTGNSAADATGAITYFSSSQTADTAVSGNGAGVAAADDVVTEVLPLGNAGKPIQANPSERLIAVLTPTSTIAVDNLSLEANGWFGPPGDV
jgi:hypothetical protein